MSIQRTFECKCGKVRTVWVPSSTTVYNSSCKSCSNKRNVLTRRDYKGLNNPMSGRKHPTELRKKMKQWNSHSWTEEQRHTLSESVKAAMQRPDVRKRHIDALHHSNWIKVRTDKGCLELLDRWNKLGFNFQPNYQVKTETDLFYIDGFDVEHNVVLEYDSKYHTKSFQLKKDLIRQTKIINALKPNVFWRYNAVTKTFSDVYRTNTPLKEEAFIEKKGLEVITS